MKIGDKLPDLAFNATSNLHTQLSAYKNKWLILYFYPKDSTPGCTMESQNFRDAYGEIKALNAEIFGISRDSLKSHEKFKMNQQLPFELISDEDEQFCQLFDVIKMKSMYGKQVRGIERSSFIIDPQGILKQEWRKVKVENHVIDLIQALKNLQA